MTDSEIPPVASSVPEEPAPEEWAAKALQTLDAHEWGVAVLHNGVRVRTLWFDDEDEAKSFLEWAGRRPLSGDPEAQAEIESVNWWEAVGRKLSPAEALIGGYRNFTITRVEREGDRVGVAMGDMDYDEGAWHTNRWFGRDNFDGTLRVLADRRRSGDPDTVTLRVPRQVAEEWAEGPLWGEMGHRIRMHDSRHLPTEEVIAAARAALGSPGEKV
jgi:hypothetical protein